MFTMEQTLFIKFLGDSPKIRVLDMLITGRELDYSISDIANEAGISRSTFYGMINQMLRDKVIVKTRKFGMMQLYKLNLKNKHVKSLVKLYDNLLLKASRNAFKRQRIKAISS